MPHYSKYQCTECGEEVGRGNLIRKKVDFVEMGLIGRPGRTIRSRTTKWLCKAKCLLIDADYNIQPQAAPGMRSEPLERVRAAQGRAS